MRSLVEHLTARLERVEEGRSFGSASSGRYGYVDHEALERYFAIVEGRDSRAQGMEGRSLSKVVPPPPPMQPELGFAHPGLGHHMPAVPPLPSGSPIPPVHHMSAQHPFDPFQETLLVASAALLEDK